MGLIMWFKKKVCGCGDSSQELEYGIQLESEEKQEIAKINLKHKFETLVMEQIRKDCSGLQKIREILNDGEILDGLFVGNFWLHNKHYVVIESYGKFYYVNPVEHEKVHISITDYHIFETLILNFESMYRSS